MGMSFHKDGTQPVNGEVFVFGSNTAGRHGKGAAKAALTNFRAIPGVGVGRQGNSYGIPTKDQYLRTLPLSHIHLYVKDFLDYARLHPEINFFVTRIGCVLAGYQDEQIAPLFLGAPDNCSFAEEWQKYLTTTEEQTTSPMFT